MKDLYKLAAEFLKLSQSKLPGETAVSNVMKSPANVPGPQKINKTLQYSLNRLGYPGPRLRDTGVLDEDTKAAIGWFRKTFNVPPGGNVEKQVRDELMYQASLSAGNSSAPAPAARPAQSVLPAPLPAPANIPNGRSPATYTPVPSSKGLSGVVGAPDKKQPPKTPQQLVKELAK